MNNIVFAHFRDSWNFGDNNCCPVDYFNYPGAVRASLHVIPPGDSPVILGGGGIFFKGSETWLPELSRRRPVIVWGAGLNYPRCGIPDDWADMFKHCVLVGLRDRDYSDLLLDVPSFFTPCPSCMHPAFEICRNHQPRFQAVVYEHVSCPLGLVYPTRSNDADSGHSMQNTIEFLASGRVIVTNSFHGAYWGLLLGRRVILYRPLDSNRYYTALPKLLVTDDEDVVRDLIWNDSLLSCVVHQGWFKAMQHYTTAFKALVDHWLKRHGYPTAP